MSKLPLEIGKPIMMQLMTNKKMKTQTYVIGAKERNYIIVERPKFHMNDRLVSVIDGNIACRYISDGEVYDFMSNVIDTIKYDINDIVFISYPEEIRVTNLRRARRIKVNIECKIKIDNINNVSKCVMSDISSGGCYQTINSLIVVAQGMKCKMNFTLPDNQKIETIDGIIRSVKHVNLRKQTELGIEFDETCPAWEKINNFCNFCMYFEV